MLARRDDDMSDTSSINSQQSGSYDPNKADFAAGQQAANKQADLIPTSVDDGDGGIQLISAKTKAGV